MSLWDRDKRGRRRLSPVTENQDRIAPEDRMSHGTQVFTLRDEGDSTSVTLRIKDGKLEVTNSSGSVISRLGYRSSDQDGAVDVAKPGEAL